MNEQKIIDKKYKICLEYHIGNCLGPCENLLNEETYNQYIVEIKEILKGNFKNSLHSFKKEMKDLSINLKFEQANLIKEKINALENYQYKSTVVSPKISNVDVFSYIEDENNLPYGSFDNKKNNELKLKEVYLFQIMGDLIKIEKIIELAAIEIRLKFNSLSPIIYCSIAVDLGENVKIEVPKIGDKTAN